MFPENTSWRRRRDVQRQSVPPSGSSDRKSSIADGWKTGASNNKRWCWCKLTSCRITNTICTNLTQSFGNWYINALGDYEINCWGGVTLYIHHLGSACSGLVVTRLLAAREGPSSNRAAVKSLCFHENHCDTQLWARAAHLLQCLCRLSFQPSEER